MKRCLVLIPVVLLAACATGQQAPVVEHAPTPAKKAAPPTPSKPAAAEKDWRPDTYTVKKGDTLYSIGLEFGYDYKEIAQLNNIQPPYVIYIGRQLKLRDGKAVVQALESTEAVTAPLKAEPAATAKSLDEPPLLTEPKAVKVRYSEKAMTATEPAQKPATKPDTQKPETSRPVDKPAEVAKSEPKAEPAAKSSAPNGDDETLDWAWPANGKLLAGFNDAASAKGVDIGGSQGQPVLAAAGGKVVYSGSGLRGYGKLVIIKHNKTYLSAYAHNSQLLVKEGQVVAKGQKIAEMGNSDTDRVKLHFEIRKLGKPVDPSKYLPASSGA